MWFYRAEIRIKWKLSMSSSRRAPTFMVYLIWRVHNDSEKYRIALEKEGENFQWPFWSDMLTLWTFRSFGNDFNIWSFLNKLDPCLGSLIFVQFVDFDKRIWTLKKVTHVTVLFQKETSKIDPIFWPHFGSILKFILDPRI